LVAVVEAVGAVGEALGGPAAFVDEVVVFGAQGYEVVEVGGAALIPGFEVVDVAPVVGLVAPVDGAGGVQQA
jgi:hypothetical protein